MMLRKSSGFGKNVKREFEPKKVDEIRSLRFGTQALPNISNLTMWSNEWSDGTEILCPHQLTNQSIK